MAHAFCRLQLKFALCEWATGTQIIKRFNFADGRAIYLEEAQTIKELMNDNKGNKAYFEKLLKTMYFSAR